MKKAILIHIALSFWSISFAQWTNQVSGTTEDLKAIQMVNSHTGYIVGTNGTILKTIDSGENWTPLNSTTTVHLESLFFVDTDTGFASGSYYNTTIGNNEGVLLKTIDGGLNWIDLNFPFEENLSDIFFLNPNVGFAACLSDGLFRTVDGGLNWTHVSSTMTKAIFLTSELVGYSLSGGGIGKTIDGGLNWQQIKDDNSPDYNGANILESIFFTSDTTGFLGSPYYIGIYSTINGGLTLDFSSVVTISIHFPSDNIGYAITNWDGSTISQTTDSGLNWNEIYQSNTTLNDIFFSSDDTGWAVGQQGTILRSKEEILSVDDVTKLHNQISIYPNPSNSSITIDLKDNLTITKLSIYNSLGALAFGYTSNQKTIWIDELPKGVYILKIETVKETIFKKIIKE